jgi:SAM-dependent methyltransferase
MHDPVELFSNGAFLNDAHEFLFAEQRFEAAPAEVEAMLRLVGYSSGKVCDLGCGAGVHLRPLLQKGIPTVAVDRSPETLQAALTRLQIEQQDLTVAIAYRADERMAEPPVELEVVRCDIRHFRPFPGEFALVVSLHTSLGYFSLPEHVELFRTMRDGLAADGVLFIDLASESLMRLASAAVSIEDPANHLITTRSMRLDDETHELEVTYVARDQQGERSYSFRVHAFNPDRLEACLREAGFSKIDFFGSLTGEAWTPESLRLVAVARP